MSVNFQLEQLVLIALATLLSMLIGLERELQRQPAGMRTHMLVGMGACVFTIISLYAFPDSESARVAAQVVSGVGFLGAGTILQAKSGVKNLTTAASIWATTAVGMAVGVGAWVIGIGVTIIILVILHFLQKVEVRWLNKENYDN